MAGLIYDLIDLVNEQADYYDMLLQLAKEKSGFLQGNKLEEINSTTIKERAIVSKIQKIEKNQQTVLKDIAIVVGQNKDEITLHMLLQMISNQADEHDKLQKAAMRLRALLDDVKEVNNKNNTLIHQSLDYIEYMMNVVQSSREIQPPAYPNSGDGIGSRSMFDRKQ